MNIENENERKGDFSNIDFINFFNWYLYLFFKYH